MNSVLSRTLYVSPVASGVVGGVGVVGGGHYPVEYDGSQVLHGAVGVGGNSKKKNK